MIVLKRNHFHLSPLINPSVEKQCHLEQPHSIYKLFLQYFLYHMPLFQYSYISIPPKNNFCVELYYKCDKKVNILLSHSLSNIKPLPCKGYSIIITNLYHGILLIKIYCFFTILC